MEAIKDISNDDGCLIIKEVNGRFYWILEGYNTDLSSLKEWDEISEGLFNELLNHKNSKI